MEWLVAVLESQEADWGWPQRLDCAENILTNDYGVYRHAAPRLLYYK